MEHAVPYLLRVSTLFYLGAKDQEMDRIQDVLTGAGYKSQRLVKAGDVVNPTNAYRGDKPKIPDWAIQVVAVECAWTNLWDDPRVIFVDHHCKGSMGYGAPPERFWQASSIGQVWELIGRPASLYDRLTAAYDHCPEQALMGMCPGIDPAELQKLRNRWTRDNADYIREGIRYAR